MTKNKLVIIMNGLPATGKTRTSLKLQKALSLSGETKMLTSLEIRKKYNLFNLYSEDQRQETYQKLAAQFIEACENEEINTIIIDGNFNKERRREMIYLHSTTPIVVIRCVIADMNVVENRLQHRKENSHIYENKADTMELYHLIARGSTPIEADNFYEQGKVALIEFDTHTKETRILNKGTVSAEALRQITEILHT